jgi:glycosyltransferase involved in cell wall biosynthesis
MDKVVEISHPNIVIQGYVEDLTTLFESHRLSIAPLRFGAGTKGKVISSLCHGIPCVVTSVACEGMIGIENDVHLSIRNKPIEFAKRCVELHNDESKWDMIAANALMYAQEYASISTMERALLDSFKRLTNEPCDSQKQIA